MTGDDERRPSGGGVTVERAAHEDSRTEVGHTEVATLPERDIADWHRGPGRPTALTDLTSQQRAQVAAAITRRIATGLSFDARSIREDVSDVPASSTEIVGMLDALVTEGSLQLLPISPTRRARGPSPRRWRGAA